MLEIVENSVKVINQAIDENITDCMVVFNDLVLKASRTVKISESSFRAFDSPSAQHIGEIKSTGVVFNKNLVTLKHL